MSVHRFAGDDAQRSVRVRLALALVVLAFSLGASRRQDSSTLQLVSASPSPTANSSAANSGSTGSVVSYADVVSRVAPAVVTIHLQMRATLGEFTPQSEQGR